MKRRTKADLAHDAFSITLGSLMTHIPMLGCIWAHILDDEQCAKIRKNIEEILVQTL